MSANDCKLQRTLFETQSDRLDTGPDDANQAHEGVYVLAANGVGAGPVPERDLRDHRPDSPRSPR